MGKGSGIAGVLELPKHLLVRKDLSGIEASQFKETAQEGRFIHSRHEQDIPGNRGLNKRINDIVDPTVVIVN
ncbi:hypothetical protein ES703_77747 [subsurface metagenome]